jgi:hypothetical protein
VGAGAGLAELQGALEHKGWHMLGFPQGICKPLKGWVPHGMCEDGSLTAAVAFEPQVRKWGVAWLAHPIWVRPRQALTWCLRAWLCMYEGMLMAMRGPHGGHGVARRAWQRAGPVVWCGACLVASGSAGAWVEIDKYLHMAWMWDSSSGKGVHPHVTFHAGHDALGLVS